MAIKEACKQINKRKDKNINQNSFVTQKDFGYDYRVVFDWSDSNIEFNVQFVSPSKKFFNWSNFWYDFLNWFFSFFCNIKMEERHS